MGSGPWGERTCRTFSRVSPARSRSSAPRRLTRRAHRITVPRSTSTRTAWWSGRSSFPERWSGTSSSHDGGRGTRDEGRVESRQHPSPVPRPAPDRFLLMSNLLASEPSAYLKSAAHQPVHWHPWGDAALARARAEDKPILLDIGVVRCHWCHVMGGESYEDARVADLLNADFVCIKVDRDERPDVDTRYQRAVQALTGQRSEEHTSELQSRLHLVCRLLLEKKNYRHTAHPDDQALPHDNANVLHYLHALNLSAHTDIYSCSIKPE